RRPVGYRQRTAGRTAPTATELTGARGYRNCRREERWQQFAPPASDRFALAPTATRPAARQRRRPDAETFGGQVSLRQSLLGPAFSIRAPPTERCHSSVLLDDGSAPGLCDVDAEPRVRPWSKITSAQTRGSCRPAAHPGTDRGRSGSAAPASWRDPRPSRTGRRCTAYHRLGTRPEPRPLPTGPEIPTGYSRSWRQRRGTCDRWCLRRTRRRRRSRA